MMRGRRTPVFTHCFLVLTYPDSRRRPLTDQKGQRQTADQATGGQWCDVDYRGCGGEGTQVQGERLCVCVCVCPLVWGEGMLGSEGAQGDP